MGCKGIGCESTRVDTFKPIRRVDFVWTYTHAGLQDQKAVDAFLDCEKRRVWLAEVLRVPRMYSGLVRDLHSDAKISQ